MTTSFVSDIDRYFIEQYIDLNLMWELDRDNPASRMSLEMFRERLQATRSCGSRT